MNPPGSHQIIARFFRAFRELKSSGRMRFMAEFIKKHRLDRRNFMRNETNPETSTFHMEWLTYLVEDYDVSAHWLLTGKGEMFKNPDNKNSNK